VQKRRYKSGYHIEFFAKEHKTDFKKNEPEVEKREMSNECLMASADTASAMVIDHLPKTYPQASSDKKESQATVKRIKRKQVLANHSKAEEPNDNATPQKINAEVHPSAAGSFLMGVLSALSFIMLFAIQFNPVWLVVALIIALIVFALLAKKMAKQAFDDMYYARNRYSGKGLAAAGLALGVVSIVALIGLALVILFGIAFISFS
jgi:hypothetical protein